MHSKKDFKELLKVYGVSALLVAAGFYVAYQFVGPAPTKNILIATGNKAGAYYSFGNQYAKRFAKAGVKLTVLESAGSIDNLSLLTDTKHSVYAALIQGGVGSAKENPQLESLGSLYYEPLWLFHAKTTKIDTLSDLKGKRIVIGSPGSGTRILAGRLLAENGVTAETARFLEMDGEKGTEALASQRADALFVVAGVTSDRIMRLLENSEVSLYSFRRGEAYHRIFKYLSKITLPQGSVDLKHNIPDHDITLIAPSANLVIRKDLHPALIYLFLMAMEEIHSEGGLLENRGAFPSPEGAGFPLNKEARKFYQSGPPFLMRVLPFWLATWLVRMFVMLIPLVTVLYPLIKIAPPTYSWRIRRKVNKLYKQLYQIELDFEQTLGGEELANLLDRLDALDHRAAAVHVPTPHLESHYNLRRHIELVRKKIIRAHSPPPSEPSNPP
jgi:TRAP transporter TAXI family solute receptor